jgi:uncharacterized protein (DUF1697 family)
MKTYIALFRGINVGGSNILPMKELVLLLENLGLRRIRTYIQSGNVVFQSTDENISQLSKRIGETVRRSRGFAPHVMIVESGDLKRAIDSNPFPEAESEPKTLHMGFLSSVPENPDLNGLEKLRKENERFSLIDDLFYLHAPDGIGRSKLAAKAEKLLGVTMTDRNWRTVQKIIKIAEENQDLA